MTNLQDALNMKSLDFGASKTTPATKQPALDFGKPDNTNMPDILNQQLELQTDIGDWQGQDLSPNAPELALALKESLTHLQEALKAGDVSTALSDTKIFIDNNPALKDLLMPEDINLFVKALQSSHSIVIAKKTTRKASKSATNVAAEKLADELGDLGDFSL